MTKCEICGLESEIEGAFFKVAYTRNPRQRLLCPACKSRKQRSDVWFRTGLNLAMGVAGICLVVKAPQLQSGWILLNGFLFQIALFAGIIPHELGHALAARFLGLRLFSIAIGSGPAICECRAGDITVRFNAMPYGGRTLAQSQSMAWYRLKYFLYIAAGPLINFLAAAMIWPFISLREFGGITSHLLPWPMLFVANLAIALENLWPRTMVNMDNPHYLRSSDGLQLFRTLRITKDKIKIHVTVGYPLTEGMEARRLGKHSEAKKWFDQAVAFAPDNAEALGWQAINLLDLDRPVEARDIFLGLLNQTGIKPEVRALFLNNVAYAGLMSGNPDLLAEADAFSKEALETMPWVSNLKGTRGGVLCRMGRMDEGIELLTEAMKQSDEMQGKATNACHLAEAEQSRGNIKRSEELWEIASSFDPQCILLKHRSRSKPASVRF